MFTELINHNADIKQLVDEGYEVELSNSDLIIHNVPYVNDKKQIDYGTLVSRSKLTGFTMMPNDHVVFWVGDYPCDHNGSQLTNLVNNPNMQEKIRDGLVATHSFSQKPQGGYENHYQKMERYVQLLENYARAINNTITAKMFKPIKLTEEESIFCYFDTASSRAGIMSINEKLKKGRMAIVGLGGTGSYILDLVAKTPVEEIHLFDGDKFHNHNAFRSPGAPSDKDLQRNMAKVEWFAEIYSRMRRKIIPHPQSIDESNVIELNSMDMVFLCIDKNQPRKIIVDYLIDKKIPFIDVGIGIDKANEMLTGSLRITTCTPSFHDHATKRILFGSDEDNEYSSNIQIADINALNAVLAVIKWKKMCGFYDDLENEHNSVYGIGDNEIVNEDSK